MKYHDILDIYVTASPEQIEKAYADKIAALNSCEASPLLKQKKTAEFSKAREDCLKYCDKSFSEKCSMEIVDIGRSALEPNRVNDCCGDCNSCCLNCCSCACYGVIGAVVLGIVGGVASKILAQKRAEAEEQRRIAEENAARRRSEQLNELIAKKTNDVSQCTAKRATLNAELNHRQELLNAQNKIFEESRQNIIAFCNKINLPLTETEISNSPAITAMKQEVLALNEEVANANRAINENETRISTSIAEAERARNELRNH